MASFNVITSSKVLSPNSHILSEVQGWGLQHRSLGGGEDDSAYNWSLDRTEAWKGLCLGKSGERGSS